MSPPAAAPALAATTPPAKKSKFNIAAAATPQGSKRAATEVGGKMATPLSTKVSRHCIKPIYLPPWIDPAQFYMYPWVERIVRIDVQVPKANDVKIEDAPRPLQQPRRLPASGPVVVCIYKVTDDAGGGICAYFAVVCMYVCAFVIIFCVCFTSLPPA